MRQTPPTPENILGPLLFNGQRTTVNIHTVKCLRNAESDARMHDYIFFCQHFLSVAMKIGDWKYKSTRNPMSKFVDCSMEAFIILLYTNGYRMWMKNLREPASDSELSGSSDVSPRFTAKARGTAKFSGWSEDGIRLYNLVHDVLVEQRKRPGCNFESTLQKECVKLYTQESSGNNRNKADDATNGLERLWTLMGGMQDRSHP